MAKKRKSKDKPSTLELAKKAIIQKYGSEVISELKSHEDLKVDVISTGCLALDSALGVGGLARGRLHEMYGPNSSGKSTLALSVCMQALKKNLNVVYIDAEHSLDPKLVRNMGEAVDVNPDSMEIVQAFTGDDNLEIAERLMKTGEVAVLVVDSVSALLPKDMAEGEIGDNYIGLLARLMSKACVKLTPVANYTNTLLIFVNQIRHQIGKWGNNEVPTGGEALSFYATTRIKVDGGETNASRIISDEGIVIGHKCDFKIVKNKLAAPWRTASINLIYGVGYDYIMEVVDLAIQFGIIDQQGAWFSYKDNKIQGKQNLVKYFVEESKEYKLLRNNVSELLGLVNNESTGK